MASYAVKYTTMAGCGTVKARKNFIKEKVFQPLGIRFLQYVVRLNMRSIVMYVFSEEFPDNFQNSYSIKSYKQVPKRVYFLFTFRRIKLGTIVVRTSVQYEHARLAENPKFFRAPGM